MSLCKRFPLHHEPTHVAHVLGCMVRRVSFQRFLLPFGQRWHFSFDLDLSGHVPVLLKTVATEALVAATGAVELLLPSRIIFSSLPPSGGEKKK